METLSKTKLKHFASLSLKKQRNTHLLFVVEGVKMVNEALASGWQVEAVILKEGMEALMELPPSVNAFLAQTADFAKIVQLQSPEGVLAVVHFPEKPTQSSLSNLKGPGFILDGIQDPGNLGTILRIADWFGFEHVVCGPGTADLYNPKSLRASMGAVFRVKVHYEADLASFIENNPANTWMADMHGQDYRKAALQNTDWILIGNEANGVSAAMRALSHVQPITIPRKGGAESLNAAVAAGILAGRLADIQSPA